jgi:hypothetical protein
MRTDSLSLYDIKNGVLGIKRDVFCLLIKIIGDDERKIRNVLVYFLFMFD